MKTDRQVIEQIARYSDDPVDQTRVDQLWEQHVKSHQSSSVVRRAPSKVPALIAVTVAVVAIAVGASTGLISREVATHPADTSINLASCATKRQVITKVYDGKSQIAPSNREGSKQGMLVPGSPRSVLLCHYYPMNTARVGNLESQRVLNAADATALAALFNAGNIQPQPLPKMYCGADYDDIITATFTYSDLTEPSVQVTYNKTSCRLATTQRDTATTTAALQQQLDALLA